MSDAITRLLSTLEKSPAAVSFSDVMQVISDHYHYTPCRFTNGDTVNDAGTNEGSCKILAFAKLQGLDEQQTLHLFGDYYRIDVLQHPDGDDHQNIRNFMVDGWFGVAFEAEPLAMQ